MIQGRGLLVVGAKVLIQVLLGGESFVALLTVEGLQVGVCQLVSL